MKNKHTHYIEIEKWIGLKIFNFVLMLVFMTAVLVFGIIDVSTSTSFFTFYTAIWLSCGALTFLFFINFASLDNEIVRIEVK